MTMGDRVAVLKKGELMQVDEPQTLYDYPGNLFVAGFIGSPAMNLCEAELEGSDGGDPQLRLGSDTVEVPDAALATYPQVRDRVGGKVAVGFRPEHGSPGDGDAPSGQSITGEVTLVEALGSEVVVHMHTDAHPVVTEDMREAVDDPDAFAHLEETAAKGMDMTFRFDPQKAPKNGERLRVDLRTEWLHFFDIDSGESLR
jgi:multiple sugar transport system ATP-binding protein